MNISNADLSRAPWRKSSYSGGGNDTCVEVAPIRRMVAVRDSKNPALDALAFTPAQWRTFTKKIKA